MPSNLEVAQRARLKPIAEIAAALGVEDDELELYGRYKAKVVLSILHRLASRPDGKYIDVTSITPTPLGEGKTTTTVGLAMALNRIGCRAIATIRQPSLGPTFGIKGGASGGGLAQVVPMEDLNLHLTGDVHAISLAHNLLAAMVDNSITHGNPLDIDPLTITWPRVVDVNDRALRKIVIGLGGRENGYPREAGFDISVASEAMAILGLATSLRDLRARLGRIVVALDRRRQAVTAEQLRAAGAMAVLMRDAIKPTLLQTVENTPAFVHAGPFGNIATGNSSILADLIGLKLGDCVVTESGFGADMGLEKFVDIKCRTSGRAPDAVVLVCTVRALKMHSGRYKVVAGKPLDPGLLREDLAAVEAGCANLDKQIENVHAFGLPVVVAINVFDRDTPAEIELVRARAVAAGALGAYRSEVWAQGGAGAEELARAVLAAAARPTPMRFLYPLDLPIRQKIEAIARTMYGADGVDYSAAAETQIARYTELGYGNLAVCVAKTHLSLSHDPTLLGRPRGFRVPVREVRASVGAGFLYPLLGEMRTMPGLPSEPNAWKVDLDGDGNVVGLF
ncbi:MAG: formate--tetrahydrofolate ligase [Candidatus Rokuibacteriota bacterium]|nr:MAG: formate--tetrahydrofolate ligase [Candidatus Rokubacteria bacterium]